MRKTTKQVLLGLVCSLVFFITLLIEPILRVSYHEAVGQKPMEFGYFTTVFAFCFMSMAAAVFLFVSAAHDNEYNKH